MDGMTLGEAVIRLSLTAVPVVVTLAAARRLRHANSEYAFGWYHQPLGWPGRAALACVIVAGLFIAIRFGPAILFDRQLPLTASAVALLAIPIWLIASLICAIDRHLWARRHLPTIARRTDIAPPRSTPPPQRPSRQAADYPAFRSRRLPNPAPGDIHAA